MNRRTLLGGVGVAGLTALSGCLGVVGMDEHEASPGSVEEGVYEDAGYEPSVVTDIAAEEEVSIGPYSEDISVTNYATEYQKEVSMGPLGNQSGAIAIVLTTPQIGVAGQNFNPIEDKSAEEFVEMLEDEYDDISTVSHDEKAEITILGTDTIRSRFVADATYEGYDTTVDLHVSEAVPTDNDDLLLTICIYPQDARDDEEEYAIEMMEEASSDEETNETDEDSTDEDDDGVRELL